MYSVLAILAILTLRASADYLPPKTEEALDCAVLLINVNSCAAAFAASVVADATAKSYVKTYWTEESLRNGAGDAFRHCFWNALMTIGIGEGSARKLADNHEKGSSGIEVEMDLNNNAYGRNVAAKGSEASAKDKCRIAAIAAPLCSVSKGALCVIDKPQATAMSSSPPPVLSSPTTAGSQSYTVRGGDTVSGIAQASGTSIQALLDANPSITNPEKISVGQVLVLPKPAPSGRKSL